MAASCRTPVADSHVKPERKSTKQINKEFENFSEVIDQAMADYAKRPKRVWYTATSKNAKYHDYYQNWQRQIAATAQGDLKEQIKNLRHDGDVLINVAIFKNGRLERVTVRRSSGHKDLDQLAARIVQKSAPFDPLPDHLDADILHIVRTFSFRAAGE